MQYVQNRGDTKAFHTYFTFSPRKMSGLVTPVWAHLPACTTVLTTLCWCCRTSTHEIALVVIACVSTNFILYTAPLGLVSPIVGWDTFRSSASVYGQEIASQCDRAIGWNVLKVGLFPILAGVRRVKSAGRWEGPRWWCAIVLLVFHLFYFFSIFQSLHLCGLSITCSFCVQNSSGCVRGMGMSII